MTTLLASSLFENDKKRFNIITEDACFFAVNYWGNSIIGENIFNIVKNFAIQKEIPLELLEYPFHDDELWALTLKKKGTIFVCINNELPICKQVFAAAHELYHIYLYSKNTDETEASMVSLLDSKTANERAETKEDIEANAFAALLLMPTTLLKEQLSFFNISENSISVDDILSLMDSFGIPFKAIVLRLYECSLISESKATELLSVSTEDVEKRSIITGRARRWLTRDRGIERFGSLLENIEFNKTHDFLMESRIKSDESYLASLFENPDSF